jgi:methyl-accepting chemotaxis protein
MNAEAERAGSVSVRKLFLTVIVLKIAASAAGWWLQSPWLLGFALPLALMGVYIGVGLRRGDDSVSDEKFADSCYYLGFIFTISSILISLFDVPAISTRLGDIAIRFGAALVSTVLGLIVRVYLVSFRPEFQDGVRNAETGLLDAVRSFRMHLDLSVNRLNEFQTQVGEASRLAVAQSDLAIRDATEAHARQFGALFEQLAGEYRRHFEDSTVHLKAATQTLSSALYDYAQSLVAGTGAFEGKVADFVGGLETRVQDVALPEDFFTGRLDPALASLGRSVQAAGGQVEALAAELRENVRRISGELNGIGERAAAAAGSLDKVRETVEGHSELMAAAREQTRVLAQLAATLDKMETSVSRSLASIGTLEQTVRQVVDEAAEVVRFNREVGLLIQRQSEATAGVRREMEQWLPRLRENDEAILGRLDETTRGFDRALGQVAATLASQEAALARLSAGAETRPGPKPRPAGADG